jgi:hypothetical protein
MELAGGTPDEFEGNAARISLLLKKTVYQKKIITMKKAMSRTTGLAQKKKTLR